MAVSEHIMLFLISQPGPIFTELIEKYTFAEIGMGANYAIRANNSRTFQHYAIFNHRGFMNGHSIANRIIVA